MTEFLEEFLRDTLSVRESLTIENAGASGWVATLRDRHGKVRYLGQDDSPIMAVRSIGAQMGADLTAHIETMSASLAIESETLKP